MNTMQKDVKTTRVVWKGTGLDFSATLGAGYKLDLGSPAGEAAGSPMELLLAGVAGCTAVDVVHILRKQRQAINGVEVVISGERAADHPKVYTHVTLQYVVQGHNVDPEAVARAIELSETKYCSASMIFRQAGVDFDTSYRIEETGAGGA